MSNTREKLLIRFFLFYLGIITGIWMLMKLRGPAVYLMSAAVLVMILLGLEQLLAIFNKDWKRIVSLARNVALSGLAFFICLFIFESFLHLEQSIASRRAKKSGSELSAPEGGTARIETLTMPKDWEWKNVDVEGAESAFYWHGILHVFDSNMMRRTKPFPGKQEGVYRIMLVGDSLTYGMGVYEKDTYGSVIERELDRSYRVEVLNLGVCAYHSEDILERVVKVFTPLLDPDLIVYGVCINDFLPSSVSEYSNNRAYRFPLPKSLKRFLTSRTLAGRFFEERYDQIMIKIGLRTGFVNDILKNFRSYQTRFLSDLKTMNDYVKSKGLPPVVAGVIHQFPAVGSPAHKVTGIAERLITEAGMTLVPAEDYFREYDGMNMGVSRWEGHPNEEAHGIFADNFMKVLIDLPSLQPYRKVE